MKPTVKILLVLLAALTAETAPAQDNICPLGGIIYQHGNIIWRDLDGDISEQEAEDFRDNGLRFRVDPAYLAGAYGETGRYRAVTLKVVFGSPGIWIEGNTSWVQASWVQESAIPHETNHVVLAGADTRQYDLMNLGDGYFRLSRHDGPLALPVAAPRMIYTGDVCFYEAEDRAGERIN